jgi:hypothetical protein
MVQPKYSPEEALQRIKLMMEYDSSKTYTENKIIVENKILLNEAPPVVVGLGAKALAWLLSAKGIAAVTGAGIVTAAAAEYSTAEIDEQIRMALGACDSATGEAAKKSMSEVEQAEVSNKFREAFNYRTFGIELPFGIGGGTDLTLVKEALSILKAQGRMGDFCQVRAKFGPGASLENRMVSELNTSELTWVLGTIDVLAAKSKPGDVSLKDQDTAQLEWWIDNFPCLAKTNSFADPMEVSSNRFGMTFIGVNFKVKGEIKPFKMDKDARIYIPDPSGGTNHTLTGKRVNCATETKVSIVTESVKKKRISEQADLGDIDFSPVDVDLGGGTPTPSPDPGTTPPVTTSRYRTCSGSYSYGCKTDPTGPIGVVQGCLGGLVVDGKFGPKTQAALKAKGYESFTDAEVDKICGNPTGVDSEISGESPADIDQNNLDF